VRTHPPTLLTLAARTIKSDRLLSRGDRILVAVSGGPDSMALLHVLAVLRKKVGHTLVAHGVDHGLRAEAGAELDLAEHLARDLDVPFTRTRLSVRAGGNLQARAREARYAALRDEAARTSSAVIATAHHADDRAETVLMRLLRGAGPSGLAVLPPRAGDLVRPFLRARRSDIITHLSRHEIPHATDPSNREPRFLRPRVRHELLPVLTALSPSIVDHLCALADQLGEQDDPLSGLPRNMREALTKLARDRSPRTRVFLGQGLVARYDRPQLTLVVEHPLNPEPEASVEPYGKLGHDSKRPRQK